MKDDILDIVRLSARQGGEVDRMASKENGRGHVGGATGGPNDLDALLRRQNGKGREWRFGHSKRYEKRPAGHDLPTDALHDEMGRSEHDVLHFQA